MLIMESGNASVGYCRSPSVKQSYYSAAAAAAVAVDCAICEAARRSNRPSSGPTLTSPATADTGAALANWKEMRSGS